ncbi:MAG: hypothetical protein FJW66_00685 [Actinobacteria bacterium]|nr:hypothetical protein [Actinomycetota bacterium]
MNSYVKSPGYLRKGIDGNISITAVFLLIFFAFIFLVLTDICRVFVVRSVTKKASDSAVLAISQQILFFENEEEIESAAQQILDGNNCRLKNLNVSYDEVTVVAEKQLDFILLKCFGVRSCKIYSASRSKVIYPWDEKFGLCNRHRFDY